jgi:hypothetical protein
MLRLTARGVAAHLTKARRLTMNRRKLLKAAGAAVACTAVAAPAIAQSAPALRWRLTTCEATYDYYMIRRIRA